MISLQVCRGRSSAVRVLSARCQRTLIFNGAHAQLRIGVYFLIVRIHNHRDRTGRTAYPRPNVRPPGRAARPPASVKDPVRASLAKPAHPSPDPLAVLHRSAVPPADRYWQLSASGQCAGAGSRCGRAGPRAAAGRRAGPPASRPGPEHHRDHRMRARSEE